MSTHNKEAVEREAFEKWGGRRFKLDRYLDGYTTELTNQAWAAWLARSALTASEAPATEQAPPLPDCVAWGIMKRGDRVWYINDSRFTCEGYAQHYAHRDAHGVDQNVIPVFTADQVQTYAEQYAAWKIAALRSEQAPAGEVPEPLSVEELQQAWNAQADVHNRWDELGLDEIVHFAQMQYAAQGKDQPK